MAMTWGERIETYRAKSVQPGWRMRTFDNPTPRLVVGVTLRPAMVRVLFDDGTDFWTSPECAVQVWRPEP